MATFWQATLPDRIYRLGEKRFFALLYSANMLVKKSHAGLTSMAREFRRAELKGRGIKSTWILIKFRCI